MDLDFSRKMSLIFLLGKLFPLPSLDIPLGAVYIDTHNARTYIYIGDQRWMVTG